MPHRRFATPDGTVWDVWDVHPGSHSQRPTPVRAALPEDIRSGWLAFESVRGKCRLSPIPPAWQDWSERELIEALESAKAVSRRAADQSVAVVVEAQGSSQAREVGRAIERPADVAELKGTRVYTDSDGSTWSIWPVAVMRDTRAMRASAGRLPDGMADGWLCFQGPRMRCRVSPVPEGWERYTDAELDALRRGALLHSKRS